MCRRARRSDPGAQAQRVFRTAWRRGRVNTRGDSAPALPSRLPGQSGPSRLHTLPPRRWSWPVCNRLAGPRRRGAPLERMRPRGHRNFSYLSLRLIFADLCSPLTNITSGFAFLVPPPVPRDTPRREPRAPAGVPHSVRARGARNRSAAKTERIRPAAILPCQASSSERS